MSIARTVSPNDTLVDPFNSEPAVASTSGYSVGDSLFHDHQQFEDGLDEVMHLVEDGNLKDGSVRFARLARLLLRHMRWEDEIVYPLYAARTGDSRTLDELRHHHTFIQAAIAVLGDALARGDLRHYRQGEGDLRAVLRPHHLLEENVLHAWARHSLTLEEQMHLVVRHEDA
jgi:hypothetical protein